MDAAFSIAVTSQADVEQARRQTRRLALTVGFQPADAEEVVLAVSELATNLVRYAHEGHITVRPVTGPGGAGLCLESMDTGPGIANIDQALQDGVSSGGGLGSGLPAVRRLLDDFTINTGPAGTRIVAAKWLPT